MRMIPTFSWFPVMAEIPLAGASYDLTPSSTQKSVNVEPVALEASGVTRFRLKQTPGLVSFASVSGSPRGALSMGDYAYVVHDQTLSSIDSAGAVTTLGTVPGTDRVSMAANGTYVVVVNGSDGYTYNAVTETFAQITDADFLASDVVVYLDGYFVFHQTDSDNVFISALNDPTSFDATEIQAKGGTADLLVTIVPINGDLILFGSRHSFFWRNVGNVDFPFQNIEGAEMQRGCPAVHSVAGIDNSVIFLGDDLVVYWIEGYVPKRVSNHALEEYLSGLTEAQIADAYAFAYTQGGQYYYVLTVGGRTWVYNRTQSMVIQQSLWHERSSNDGVWRAQTHCYAFGKHLVGDDGTVWEVSTSTNVEGSDAIRRIRRLAPIWAEDESFTISKVRLLVRVGIGSLTTAPTIDLRSSVDGGLTWTDYKTRSVGLEGAYDTTVIWRRMGRSDRKVFEFAWDADANLEPYGLYADAG